ncbi:putative membrane protein [Ehrlichia cf. muris str. EmCRT]|uniref:Putative membrane protein n=1 Tax=Ehrlichia cf. muris str. EmCRT TaxID=1359167 RepID=A0A0F3NCP3_9RICK|nr:putative membrane protein [Ehrlichia cf. muris str. EmCRT]
MILMMNEAENEDIVFMMYSIICNMALLLLTLICYISHK